MHFLAEYGLFLAKVATILIAIILLLTFIVTLSSKGKLRGKEKLTIKSLNDKYNSMKEALLAATLSKKEHKQALKTLKKEKIKEPRKKIFVLHFLGDLKASAVKELREEITAVLQVATPQDEVVVCLDSPGGVVPNYGLAASQLQRFRQNHIPLTVAIDKVAASGGYLMACVANQILAAPFAIVGSIGVVAQLPNFHRLLKKKDIDYEQITAGEFKRTLTLFGKNTDKGREKLKEEIEDIHSLFKQFIIENRPKVDINKVATGEYWCATRAYELRLVDKLIASDSYLVEASKHADIYELHYCSKKTLAEKFSIIAQAGVDKVMQVWRQPENADSFM